MYDDDRDALAAEYVLGTLSADERDQAEALLVIDPGFAEIVRVWERRLGELNVMVEAVEPPAEVWNRVKTEIAIAGPPMSAEVEKVWTAGIAPAGGTSLGENLPPQSGPTAEPVAEPEPAMDLVPDLTSELAAELAAAPEMAEAAEASISPDEPVSAVDEPSLVEALAAQLMPAQDSEPTIEGENAESEVPEEELLPPELLAAQRLAYESPATERLQPRPPVPEILPSDGGRSADGRIRRLQQGVQRWRMIAVAMSAIAVVLAAFTAVSQFVPGFFLAGPVPQPVAAARPQPAAQRYTAVLQQEPTAPAFLITVDPQTKSFTVRTVSATPEAGRSYELWVMSSKYPAPRSLGRVGGEPFVSRPLPAGYDSDAVLSASYMVSLEPAGGSPTGAPTGPILFRGKTVESVPASPPPGS